MTRSDSISPHRGVNISQRTGSLQQSVSNIIQSLSLSLSGKESTSSRSRRDSIPTATLYLDTTYESDDFHAVDHDRSSLWKGNASLSFKESKSTSINNQSPLWKENPLLVNNNSSNSSSVKGQSPLWKRKTYAEASSSGKGLNNNVRLFFGNHSPSRKNSSELEAMPMPATLGDSPTLNSPKRLGTSSSVQRIHSGQGSLIQRLNTFRDSRKDHGHHFENNEIKYDEYAAVDGEFRSPSPYRTRGGDKFDIASKVQLETQAENASEDTAGRERGNDDNDDDDDDDEDDHIRIVMPNKSDTKTRTTWSHKINLAINSHPCKAAAILMLIITCLVVAVVSHTNPIQINPPYKQASPS